jgi:stage V sporulation protein D (sporulation-specific penicillin-binding protein)
VWCVVAFVFFGLLAHKLWSIQIVQHQEYRTDAEKIQARKRPIRAPRGNIYDRNGNPLALNLKVYSVAADPELVDRPSERAGQLQPILRIPEDQLDSKLLPGEGVRYVHLRDSVDMRVADAVRGLDCDGIIISTEWQRAYPQRHLAAALLGFIGTEMKGLGGIEAALNDRLAGADGEMLVFLDGRLPRTRSQIPGRTVITKQMQPGSSVYLTIDADIQAFAEEELAAAVESAQALGGAAIVMDPANGDVLALASYPSFDPNEFQDYPRETWVSSAVASPYEPGSTFKPIAACAAIEEGVMSHGETLVCGGTQEIGGHPVKCAPHGGSRAHGVVDLDRMVVESCNIGIARLSLALGADRMYEWAKRFGIGEKTGIELMGESRGIVSPPEDWSQIQVATVGFGQGISVTPLQLLSAYCAIANGGWRVHPRVVSKSTHPTGRTEQQSRPAPVRILSPATCDRMRELLVEVVEEGTGKAAQIPGRRVAGKTGTAQKPTPGEGFEAGKYIASFAGFAPAERPRVAVLVVIDEPQNGHYGGVVAAPAFRAICERALTHLRVPPDEAPARHEIALAGGRG